MASPTDRMTQPPDDAALVADNYCRHCKGTGRSRNPYDWECYACGGSGVLWFNYDEPSRAALEPSDKGVGR